MTWILNFRFLLNCSMGINSMGERNAPQYFTWGILTEKSCLIFTFILCYTVKIDRNDGFQSGQSNFFLMLHRCRTWTVQWCLPGGTNVHLHLTHASLGPSKSIPQTTCQSIQPLLFSSQQRVPILYKGPPPFFLKIAPSHRGSGPLSNTWFLGPTWVQNPNGILTGSGIFAGLTVAMVTDTHTDWPTDHTTPSVTISRVYVRSIVMQHNNA